jgi:hypothetical protein
LLQSKSALARQPPPAWTAPIAKLLLLCLESIAAKEWLQVEDLSTSYSTFSPIPIAIFSQPCLKNAPCSPCGNDQGAGTAQRAAANSQTSNHSALVPQKDYS